MLKRIGEIESFRFEETLTGFKWMGNRALQLRTEGYTVGFAYEEAIGFMVGDIVPDKDGISALAVFAELAYQCYERGSTLHAELENLYKK